MMNKQALRNEVISTSFGPENENVKLLNLKSHGEKRSTRCEMDVQIITLKLRQVVEQTLFYNLP